MRDVARVQRLFDRTAEKFDAFYAEKKGPFKRFIDQHFHRDIFERFELTFQHAQPIGGKTVLDVGCGSGLYCIEFARRGARRVVGIDCAPKMLELAHKSAQEEHVSDRCQFVQADFLSHPFPDHFDYSVAMGVFDYLREPGPFLQKMRGVTREKNFDLRSLDPLVAYTGPEASLHFQTSAGVPLHPCQIRAHAAGGWIYNI